MEQKEKSSVDEIRRRFDGDVERFSNLETGQQSTIDAPLIMHLVTAAAARVNPRATDVLDIGCGAGNYSLMLLQHLPDLNLTLVDLSRPMLERARERLGAATTGTVRTVQGDVRSIHLEASRYDVVMAAAVLHHLRTDREWEAVFSKVYQCLKPEGSFWIADLVGHDDPRVQDLQWERYGEYLLGLGGEAYRQHVFDYIEKEDTPRSVSYQLGLLRKTGFRTVDVLHKNACFAALGGIK